METLLLLGACSAPRSSNLLDPDVFRLDPPRGVQIDVSGGTPVIHCAFAPSGGPRRVELYNRRKPDAPWQYFTAPRWTLAGYCTSNERNGNWIDVPIRAQSEQVWLITAWDSLSHDRWGQLERYDARTLPKEKLFIFGHPDEGPQVANLVTAAVVINEAK